MGPSRTKKASATFEEEEEFKQVESAEDVQATPIEEPDITTIDPRKINQFKFLTD